MKNRRLLRLLAVLFAFVLVAAACGDDDDSSSSSGSDSSASSSDSSSDSEDASEGLNIGTLLPETGDLAFLSEPLLLAVDMAIQDINAAGGVNGADVTLTKGDSGTDPDIANTTVDRLLTENVDAIVGAAASGITGSVIDKITSAGVTQCSPSNTAAGLGTSGDDGYYFRTAPSDDLQAPVLANVVLGDGYTNVAVVSRADDYGVGFNAEFEPAVASGGGTITYSTPYAPEATSFDDVVQDVIASGPDAVVLVAFEEGVQILQTMVEQGVGPQDIQIYITDGMATGELGALIDEANPSIAAGMKGTQPAAAPSTGAAFFPDAFAEFAPDVSTIFSAQSYDCAILIALAAEAAGSNDSSDIAAQMVAVSRGGEKCSTFAACKDLLAGGADIDYDGASGAIDFLDVGEPGTGIYEVYEYDADGVQAVVEELTFEAGAAPAAPAPEPEPEPEPEEERTASEIGVTEDTIRIAVVVADLQGLIDIGYPLPAALSTDHLSERITKYFDLWNAAGGINGRTVEGVQIAWNPLDPTTMENSCIEATLDEQVFMAVNASGFSQAFIPCFTEDNDTTFFYGEVASQLMIDAAPDRLFSLNPPSEIAGEAGAELIVAQGIIPDGSKVGILSSNNPAIGAAGDAAKTVLEAAGYTTTTVEVNTLSGDNAAANAESAAAVSQFTAEGVDHVFVILPFIYSAGFWGEVGALTPSWDRTILDSASSNCTPFGASRTDPAAHNAICVTSYDSYASNDGGVDEDDAFEAECRQQFLDFFPIFEGQSDRGVASGEVGLETADGELLNSDYPPGECTMAYVMEIALTNAGINPTRDSFADAMREISGPQAFRSNGEGAFGPGKNYYSTQMQAVRFQVTASDTSRGADGSFDGCPAPTNCWIPVTGEWFVIE